MPRQTGTVEFFKADKGFGSIRPDESEREVFVHHTSIDGDGFRSLRRGDRVAFEMVDSATGPRAEGVSRL
jgi:cold shock protein